MTKSKLNPQTLLKKTKIHYVQAGIQLRQNSVTQPTYRPESESKLDTQDCFFLETGKK